MSRIYDVAVIGGGPGGYSAAVKAAQLGAKVVLFEKDTLGGTCLNVGCIPTKSLLEKAALIDKIKKNTENGLLKEAGLYSWKKIQEQRESVVKKLTGGVGSILASYGVEVVKGTAQVISADRINVQDQEYQTKKMVLATGSSVFIPPIEGIDGSNILTSTEALALKKVPHRLIIIGGGVIGMEFASIYNTFGTKITVIEMMEDIVMGEDREMVSMLKRELVKRGIRFVTGAKVQKIRDGANGKDVIYVKDGEECSCDADYVLVAVGRKPNTEGIFLKNLEKDARGNIKVNAKLETNIPNVYAVGDVAGGYQLAHAAYLEAETAAKNCMGAGEEADLSVMPRGIYGIPQLAAVGKTEEQLRAEGIPYAKGTFPYAGNGKALAAEESYGMVKVLTGRADGKILGVHIVGAYATELLSGALIAVNKELTAEEFETMIFPHPTMSEMLKEAVLATENKAIHIPKVK